MSRPSRKEGLRFKLLLAISLLVAFAVAFTLGKSWTASVETDSGESEAPVSFAAELSEAEIGRLEQDGISATECIRRIDAAYETRSVFKVHLEAGLAAKDLAGSEFARLLDALLPRTGEQSSVLKLIVLLEWSRANPNAMIQYVDTKIGDFQLIGMLYQYWADADLEKAVASIGRLNQAKAAALASLRRLKNGAVNSELERRGFLRSGSESLEVQKKIDAALADNSYLDRFGEFTGWIRRAYRNDPKAALELALSIEDPRKRDKLIRMVGDFNWPSVSKGLETLSSMDAAGLIGSRSDYLKLVRGAITRSADSGQLEESLNWLGANLRGAELVSVMNLSLQRGFGSGDPEEVLSSSIFTNLPDSSIKRQMVSNLVNLWAGLDWRAALSWLDGQPANREVSAARGGVLGTVYMKSGYAAAVDVFNRLSPQERELGVRNLANLWGNEDPLGFASWALELEDSKLMERGLSQVANRWANVDLEGARYFSESLPEGKTKMQFQRSIGNRLARLDPIEAITYTSSIENRNTARNIEVSALSLWANTEPMAAMDYLNEMYRDNDDRMADAIQSVAQQWARNDPESATRYFNELESDVARRSSMVAAINQWMAYDMGSAVAFAREESNPNTRDHLLSAAANSNQLLQADPKLAIQVAESIRDADMRERVLDRAKRRLEQIYSEGRAR